MKVSSLSKSDGATWDARVGALGAPLFHSRAWADYTTAQENADPVYLTTEDGDGLALLFRQASRNPLVRSLTTSMFSHAHPWIQDAQQFAAFLSAIEDEAAQLGAVQLTIGSFGSPGRREELISLGYEPKDRFEFFLRIDREEDEIWAGMEYKRRKHIRNSMRKAEKMGVVVEELPVEEGAAQLRLLQGSTSQRIQQRGVEVGFRVDGPQANDPIGILVRAGHGRLMGARYNGAVVSAGFFTEMNGLVYYTLAGHAPEAFECQAPTLLLWQTILHFKAAGAHTFNFGGVPFSSSLPEDPEHGLYSYKEQFGGTVELCTTGSKILKPMQYKLGQQARRVLSRT